MYALLTGCFWLAAAAALDRRELLRRGRKKELVLAAAIGLAGLLLFAAHGLHVPLPNPLDLTSLFRGGKTG
ncbi:hypothetical protein ACTHPH_12920 [Paenibacillus pasadenensis]|uniref:Uncharacterized protein n=1 Tax=Paenibacillus pasadenensis TaxID=217090 RepID=A0A2N5N330_9BACL|nr:MULTISPECIES: hypothetical protein [Paenibacillus]PLT44744.1 hypothetical protein B8V81_3175 [Paenibacillus pasadenensis]